MCGTDGMMKCSKIWDTIQEDVHAQLVRPTSKGISWLNNDIFS